MKIDRSSKDIKTLKDSIRKSVQEARDSLTEKARQEKSLAISRKFLASGIYKHSESILAYYPFRSEIDTRIIISDALSLGKKIALPRVDGKRLGLYYINDPLKDLTGGSYGIFEPDPKKCIPAHPAGLDVVIVPGVGFDRQLNRLGYGGGFYDRLLDHLSPRIPKIALAFDLQIMDNVPVSDTDLKVDILITESSVYNNPESNHTWPKKKK